MSYIANLKSVMDTRRYFVTWLKIKHRFVNRFNTFEYAKINDRLWKSH